MKVVLSYKQHTSAIIAFDCSNDKAIADLGKQFPDDEKDFHITLAFIGDVSDIPLANLKLKLEAFAKTQAPIQGKFNGYALFEDTGDGIPLVLLYDSPQLPYLRQSLREQFGDLIPEQDHGFTPHCTLAYLHKPVELDFKPFDKTFDTISLWVGEEYYDFPLTGTEVLKQLPIDEASKQRLVDVRIGIFNNDMDILAEKMFVGDVTLGQWEETAKRLIRELHTSVAAIYKGGWDQMTWEDWGRLGPVLKEQYRYLHGFAQAIADNRDTISLRAIQARAHMYGDAAMQSANKVITPIALEKQLPWMPREGEGIGMEKGNIADCLTRCCCAWVMTKMGMEKDFNIVQAVWTLSPAEHCDTCIERKGYTEVIKVYKDIEIPDHIGFYCG